jgi:molybdenum cofactor biosynthesis protein B
MSTEKHKHNIPKYLKTGIITVSTTRTMADDKSGKWIAKMLKKEGHLLQAHVVVPDHAQTIADMVKTLVHEQQIQAVLITGGTGLSPNDVTIEAVRPLFDKELSAFGVLFAQLSFEEIDSAAILSRATAGTIENAVVFCMPGSLKAVKLACKELIFPELGHIIKHLGEKKVSHPEQSESEDSHEQTEPEQNTSPLFAEASAAAPKSAPASSDF